MKRQRTVSPLLKFPVSSLLIAALSVPITVVSDYCVGFEGDMPSSPHLEGCIW